MLESAELGAQPRETLRGVFEFLQLPQPDMTAWPPGVFRRCCPKDFGVRASKQYSGGGANTGSSSAASVDTNTKACEGYAPMEAGTRAALQEFYAPHNAQLYKLLGRNYDW